jgi:CRISPR-associated endonuclease/helicase Cas3
MLDFKQMEFWAKTTVHGLPGISVFHHMLNVGYAAYFIALQKPSFLAEFKLAPLTVAVMAALHDVGKISQGFQSKCPAWLEQNGLTKIGGLWKGLEDKHAKISQFTAQNLLLDGGKLKRKSAFYWAVAVGAHHGHLHRPGEKNGLEKAAGMSKDNNAQADAAWEQERQRLARQLIEHFGELPDAEIERDSPCLWWLAGLISVADWIGSDEDNFPPDRNLSPEESRARAKEAVEKIGFAQPEIQPGLSFSELFPAIPPLVPNDLQNKALEAITEPGIYVIEAPMGMGKTEAALACAYRLLAMGKANGVYFALPTQVTSNRIHLRVDKFVEAIIGFGFERPSTRLIHANSWLMEGANFPKPSATATKNPSEDARVAYDWFASPKRALLAPFGVGTVDQALLSVIAAKHFFVRRFGLAGKVVILDEVHSYDFYTGSLIRELCKVLEELKCTVILLSATLTPERRAALLDGTDPAQETSAYPLITGRQTAGTFIEPRLAEPPEEKPVHISPMEAEDALLKAWEKACAGACVLWICDTVASAQDTYFRFEELLRQKGSGPDLGLLHSRFPYFRREELENHWMEALGKDSETKGLRPCGCVLISTQVVEQSVDLDADLLVTELAPTDMLLQRIGRLWRHPRSQRPAERAECWILKERVTLGELHTMGKDEVRQSLGAKAWVYAPYVLLRTLEEWLSRKVINVPSEIRDLLKHTYLDRDDEPEAWEAWKKEIKGDEYAKEMMAHMEANIWDVLLPDEEGRKTRLIEVETVQLILATSIQKKELVLLNGEVANLSGDAFRIEAAQALNKNLVRVPKSIFAAFSVEESTKRYVKGQQTIALVHPDGTVHVTGLKQDYYLYWHIDRGLEIRRGKEGKIDHESCD